MRLIFPGAITHKAYHRANKEAYTLLAYFLDEGDAEAAFLRLRKIGANHLTLLSNYTTDPGGTRRVRMRRNVADGTIRNFSKSLIPGESVIILRFRSAALAAIADVLRGKADTPASLFLLHDNRFNARETTKQSSAMLTIGQIKEHAESLATEHSIDQSPRHSDALVSCLKTAYRRIRASCLELSEAQEIQEGIPPVAEWILDNTFMIEASHRDILSGLPRSTKARLPTLASGKSAGLPRILDLARKMIYDYELRIEEDSIIAFLDAYQSSSPLTTGELWTLPLIIRLTLIESIADIADRATGELHEREQADFWADRLIRAGRSSSDQLFGMLSHLTLAIPKPSTYFGSQLISHLYDEDSVLILVQTWLENYYHRALGELGLRERNRQAKDQVSIGNAFASLRNLDSLDWKIVFERQSRVELILRGERSGTYPKMDFVTRDRYRREIEEMSRSSKLSEQAVATRALTLADDAFKAAASIDEITAHIGHYLIGDGRQAFIQMLGCKESRRRRALQWIYTHPSAAFFSTFFFIGFGTILIFTTTALGKEGMGTLLLMAFLAALPASQIALELIGYLAARLLPTKPLAKMDFSVSAIPDRFRTLVVVPIMLGDTAGIRGELDRLEVRYLANKEDNLLFGLFADYRDADEEHLTEDEELLSVIIGGMESLGQRYGSDHFFLFHRQRKWSESEAAYIGWERKRGKLEELNALIAGTRPSDSPNIVRIGNPEALMRVRFIITLDSDTQLPLGSARRLVETLAHPLNRPRFDENSGDLIAGYTIIQPRVSTAMPSAQASPFSRLFTDASGIDPYSSASSDLYQDLMGTGSYYGKGIYDVRAFDRILNGRFPEARLLSHDLIEGAHVRVGLASDIELYDDFPHDYADYANRQHRWIRGDWQIARWITPFVPSRKGGTYKTILSLFDRWKLLDNLRRSLLPVADLALLLGSWAISPELSLAATVIVAAQLLTRPAARPVTMLTTHKGIRTFSLRLLIRDALRAMADAALLPHQAALALDAILRAIYRTHISHRRMLQWTSAQVTPRTSPRKLPFLVPAMAFVSALAIAAAWVIAQSMPALLPSTSLWLTAWVLSPLVAWILCASTDTPQPELPQADLSFLRELARRTWRYFDDLVDASTLWLPPDNYQVSPRDELALRTSPTNIGLWMTSIVAARAFGYLTVDEAVDRLELTMKTVIDLDKFRGHLLNWYELNTARPLEPRYVSSVDSGNFLASLWTTEQGLLGMAREPLLGESFHKGLSDTGRVLARILGRRGPIHGKATAIIAPKSRYVALTRLMSRLAKSQPRIIDTIKALDVAQVGLIALRGIAPGSIKNREEEAYWIDRMESQISSAREIAQRYLQWIPILAEKPPESAPRLSPDLTAAIARVLTEAPSLKDIARKNLCFMPLLEEARLKSNDTPTREWIDRILVAFSSSRTLANETLAKLGTVALDCRSSSDQIDMRFLYDPRRRLFAIGYNVSEGRRDQSFYDLLASESRLGSFAAIARGEVPPEHWFALGRPYAMAAHRRVMLSWTGTMFEYLMPFLLQESAPGTLLDEAARGALLAQIDFGRCNRIPWGASESAFADLDINKIYQYKAFGVPALRLKRVTEEKLVIAPYASFLALGFEPRKTVRNLRRLASLGLLGTYGYFEAIDFSRQPKRSGERGVVIQAYMAHHQGMSFIALANLLMDGSIRSCFGADPRVRGALSLIYERIPLLPETHYVSSRRQEVPVGNTRDFGPSVSHFETALTRTPKTHLLSNGRYSLMISNSGGGYSRWGETDITRWRSDPTLDAWGSFLYLYEKETKRLWSPTYQPLGTKGETCSASFHIDRASFERNEGGIRSVVEIVVSPEDDVEIRRIKLTNRSLRSRNIQCTSYVELAMAAHAADRQHQAFSKLFIHTQSLPQQGALLASRRYRETDGPAMYVAHRLTSESGEMGAMRFETGRGAFIGRGHTLADPLGAVEEPRGGEGYILDPVLSLRTDIVLVPGESAILSLVVAVGGTREQAIGLMEKYADPHAITRSFDFAWAASQLELRVLHVHGEDARRFQQLASHLLYPNRLLRTTAENLEETETGQAFLWRYGISGDLPIALVIIGEIRDIGLVAEMLQAHEYWRMRGLTADLVIFIRESSGYERPLRERLEALIQSHSMNTGRDRPGGVFLLDTEHIPESDQDIITTAASVALIASRGSLAKQLSALADTHGDDEVRLWKEAPRETTNPLPTLENRYFNGYGGFTPDGREYVILIGSGMNTPAPWVNIIANPTFGTLVSERGTGFSWHGNSQRNRLTPWTNDPVIDPCVEALYLRDEDTGRYWTPTAAPIRDSNDYRISHGAGYSTFEHNFDGIEARLTVFVPMDSRGGRPVKLQALQIRNTSSRPRSFSLTYYAQLVLGEFSETSRMHVVTAWDEELGAIIARNRYRPDYGDRVAFAAFSLPADSYTGDRFSFLGRGRSPASPAAMGREKIGNKTGSGYDPCAALRLGFELAVGEEVVLECMLGEAESTAAARELILEMRRESAFDDALAETKAWWDTFLGTIEVRTPDADTNFLLNRWLLYQDLSCRIWGRSALYQSGGAFGFRDQLQDVLALLYTAPDIARKQLLLAASRQFKEGDVQHWWHGERGEGIRSRISDDMLWLPYAVAQYLKITGDKGILNEMIPFIEGPPLARDEHEVFFTPMVSSETADLYEHCRRAVKHGATAGPQGLPLMGTGDWNDGMNEVGKGGIGESVWLAWFLSEVFGGMAELSMATGRRKASASYLERKTRLIERIEAVAWDGEWYIRATSDRGVSLGSKSSTEAKTDSLPQSWAFLVLGNTPRSRQALDSAWRELVRSQDGLILLFTPPFNTSSPSPGYIQAYPPGIRENGGQYTHGAIWFAMAMARSGDGNRAGELLRMLNPMEHSRDLKSALRYVTEPYAIAADVYAAPGRMGQGGWSWYTGSAAWMYRAWLEEVLGFKLRGHRLSIDPVIPSAWDRFSISYGHGDARYEIDIENPDHVEHGVAWIELDHQRLVDMWIPLESGTGHHRVIVMMAGLN